MFLFSLSQILFVFPSIALPIAVFFLVLRNQNFPIDGIKGSIKAIHNTNSCRKFIRKAKTGKINYSFCCSCCFAPSANWNGLYCNWPFSVCFLLFFPTFFLFLFVLFWNLLHMSDWWGDLLFVDWKYLQHESQTPVTTPVHQRRLRRLVLSCTLLMVSVNFLKFTVYSFTHEMPKKCTTPTTTMGQTNGRQLIANK